MEIDVTALQRLPEIAEVTGLGKNDPIRCLPRNRTRVICVLSTCQRTQIIISSAPR
jgi:hypothetical protein